MKFLCLDFEGVLIPEIWQYVAKETNSEELMLTTQDLKNYDELMALRMKVVNEKNIKLSDIQEIVRSMNPFEGAKDFLEWAKQNFQVSIISDTFYELAWPLVEKLNYPTIICHHLKIKDDRIIDYSLRHNKQKVIQALLNLNFGVIWRRATAESRTRSLQSAGSIQTRRGCNQKVQNVSVTFYLVATTPRNCCDS